MVRMCPYSFSLTWLVIAASVVDLPEPVGPVHKIKPRGLLVISAKIFGVASSSSESTFEGIVRNATAAPRSWLYALTRNRARLGMPNEKSHSSISSYILRCASLMMSYTMACTSSCSIGGRLMRRMSPWTRIIGGRPADRCRSDALFLTANAKSSAMSIYNPDASTSCGVHPPSHAMPASSDYEPRREVVASHKEEDCRRCRA